MWLPGNVKDDIVEDVFIVNDSAQPPQCQPPSSLDVNTLPIPIQPELTDDESTTSEHLHSEQECPANMEQLSPTDEEKLLSAEMSDISHVTDDSAEAGPVAPARTSAPRFRFLSFFE